MLPKCITFICDNMHVGTHKHFSYLCSISLCLSHTHTHTKIIQFGNHHWQRRRGQEIHIAVMLRLSIILTFYWLYHHTYH